MSGRRPHSIPLVFSTTDLYGNLVTPSRQTWDSHITVGHPEMVGLENLVEDTIEDPYEVRLSKAVSTAIVYTSPSGVGPRPEGIRVLVGYADIGYEKGSTSGKVQTAYPIDTVRYSNPQIGRVIYKKGGRE